MISCSRSVLYFFSFFFYITIIISENNYEKNVFNLIHSFILFYLEINNIIWCFWLKDIIFYKDVPDGVFNPEIQGIAEEDEHIIEEQTSFFQNKPNPD